MKAKTILPLIALALCSCGGNNAKISEEKAFAECSKLMFEFLATDKGYTCEAVHVKSLPATLYDYIWSWQVNRYDGDEPIDIGWPFTTRCNVDSAGVTFFHSYDILSTVIIWAR